MGELFQTAFCSSIDSAARCTPDGERLFVAAEKWAQWWPVEDLSVQEMACVILHACFQEGIDALNIGSCHENRAMCLSIMIFVD